MGVVGVCFGWLRFGGFAVRVVVLDCGLVFIVVLVAWIWCFLVGVMQIVRFSALGWGGRGW